EIYLIGGDDGSNVLASVEEYDPKANHWRTDDHGRPVSLPSGLLSARSGAVAAVVNDQIYVVGGLTATGDRTATIEKGTARYFPTSAVSVHPGSFDPNDLVGPTTPVVSPAEILSYKIEFENEADAGLPAQRVVVTNQLDPTL